MRIQPGGFDMSAIAPPSPGWRGLLILDGLLLVRIDVRGARLGWLLGSGDFVRAWELDLGPSRQTAWQAVTPTWVAALDAEFVRRVAAAGVVSELLLRAQRTSDWLVAKSLLLSARTVEERLMFLFVLLGERWGKVTSEGVLVPLRLTHSLMARLVGARRPTVSVTLKAMQDEGLLKRAGDGGWLLCGQDRLGRPTRWRDYADALGYW